MKIYSMYNDTVLFLCVRKSALQYFDMDMITFNTHTHLSDYHFEHYPQDYLVLYEFSNPQ